MKYIDEFRDGELAKNLALSIAAEVQPGRNYSFMEFCGGHTHAISRYGLSDLLPPSVRMVHGPGCPVCVLPIGRVDMAIDLALDHGVILCTYGDTLRIPASEGLSLMKAKARGGDIRMVYSTIDALQIARDNPDREVVFFAIGFETTTPPTAVAIQQAEAEQLFEFQRTVLPRADAIGHQQHPRIAGSAAVGHGAARRFHRPGPCVHRDRQPAL